MTAFQSSKNFGFDTDMEMDFTEHSQKRGEVWKVLGNFKRNYHFTTHLTSSAVFAQNSHFEGKSLSIAIFVSPLLRPTTWNWVLSRIMFRGSMPAYPPAPFNLFPMKSSLFTSRGVLSCWTHSSLLFFFHVLWCVMLWNLLC